MRVELTPQLLTQNHTLLILALCALGSLGRHRILALDRNQWKPWIDALSHDLSDEIHSIFDEGERLDAVSPGAETVQVGTFPTSSYTVPIRLCAQDALSVLGRPLRIILENAINDRAFLLAFADDATRTLIERAENEGWLVFETGGGIGGLSARLNQAVSRAPAIESLRLMFLSDSDALVPGVLSAQARSVDNKLRRLEAAFGVTQGAFGCVLKRRAAENYAPPDRVVAWATALHPKGHEVHAKAGTSAGAAQYQHGPGGPQTPLRRLLAAIALRDTPVETRGVLCLKRGRGNSQPPRIPDSIWNQLPATHRAWLQDGFGDGFSEDFYPNNLNLPDQSGEIARFLQRLMERI